MPGANEILGCPQIKKMVLSQFISTNFWRPFLVICPNFSEISIHNIFTFISKLLSGWPPYPGCPGSWTFFLLLFMHLPLFINVYIHFFQKTPSLDAPLPPGCSEPSHPLAPPPPLHATASIPTKVMKQRELISTEIVGFYFSLNFPVLVRPSSRPCVIWCNVKEHLCRAPSRFLFRDALSALCVLA